MNSDNSAVLSERVSSPSFRVESGEIIVLSPSSDRFREHYHGVQPRSAKESSVAAASSTAAATRS
jgi:hypothetical protein